MLLKYIFSFFIFTILSYASFVDIKIGKIDKFYKNKVSKEELKSLIDEIETILESQLNVDLFNYSKNGKPIDLVYMPPSTLEKRIDKKKLITDAKNKKLINLESLLPKLKKEIEGLQKKYESKSKLLNKKISNLNSFIEEQNNKKISTNEQLIKIKKYINSKKRDIRKTRKEKRVSETILRRKINQYNTKVFTHNSLIRQISRLSNDIESMSRRVKKIKGMTFGEKHILIKSYKKHGKKTREKSIKYKMDRIEIYGFNDIFELRVILAHEIGHLLGIPHINSKGALMNPIIQSEQIKNLYLTKKDIEAFKKHLAF